MSEPTNRPSDLAPAATARPDLGAPANERLQIVYIASHGRSGSTLVGSIVGLLRGSCFVGEVRTAWEDGIRHNRACGCGRPFRECPFWTAVFIDAYGGFDTEKSRAAERTILGLGAPREAVRLWGAILARRPLDDDAAAYRRALLPLYRAIHRACGGKVIVDSSKLVRYGLVLASLPDIDIRFINLVRDVRSVVQSRARPALMRDGTTRHVGDSEAPQYRIAKVVSRWVARNELGMRLVDRFGGLRVLYEEFARDPRPTLAAFAGEAEAAAVMDRLRSQAADSGTVQHQLGGNWVRGLKLELRETWRQELPARVRLATTALAWPFLRRYRFENRRAGGLMPPH
jgi:hypothetical protein